MDSTAAIFARLAGDGLLGQDLMEWQGQPAIFSDAAPDDLLKDGLTGLIAIIAAPAADEADDTFTERARAVRQDVRLYARFTGSSATLDAMARRVRDLFHLQPESLSVEGGRVTIATASGPVAAPTTDPSLVGRRVTLRLTLQEN